MLGLLARGHDAKSAARALDISVHAVNERLRESRRKLGLTSSREAARLLLAQESRDPKYSVDKEMGVGRGRPDMDAAGVPAGRAAEEGLAMTEKKIAEAAPRVVATQPDFGAEIEPGPFLLSVTFDRPMQAGSFSFVQKSAETWPVCRSLPEQSGDGRTFTLRCTAEAGGDYEVWFNSPPYMNFGSVDGVSAEPFQLLFRARDR